ncbi:hypothetical protein [Sorangium sp. So ce1078]|uniref:hypothetical protein n=1 Tax=Sorangium sp. So ce1078 TaxID=3133329 RepID=UPI003F630840
MPQATPASVRLRLTYCANVTLGRRDFYRQLCLALGLARCSTAGDVFYAISCPSQVDTDDPEPERSGVHLAPAAAPRSARPRHRPALADLTGDVADLGRVDGDGPEQRH